MNHYCLTWIENWCFENGWSEPFAERRNEFWAFPPNGVMPVPIPAQVLHHLKQENGLTTHEKVGYLTAIGASVVAIVSTYLLDCPMPLVAAFSICAVIVAGLETED
ncbi:MAG: hypothetical protein KME15_22475 [Drouetiella hepatica Uher 2000/2452]|jgi:hypothetical protein|uniref:Uncharacterized protein n=1 Tax=Drouetiella hepatica Uher 2000/2452 TaxID=904376 RepID=A0A951UPF6_9CYAN|nr:hypothetical protein [Drouetiella hepatica Uher 2000/2452]